MRRRSITTSRWPRLRQTVFHLRPASHRSKMAAVSRATLAGLKPDLGSCRTRIANSRPAVIRAAVHGPAPQWTCGLPVLSAAVRRGGRATPPTPRRAPEGQTQSYWLLIMRCANGAGEIESRPHLEARACCYGQFCCQPSARQHLRDVTGDTIADAICAPACVSGRRPPAKTPTEACYNIRLFNSIAPPAGDMAGRWNLLMQARQGRRSITTHNPPATRPAWRPKPRLAANFREGKADTNQ